MLTVGSGEVQQVRSVFGQQRVLRKISAKTTAAEDHRPIRFELLSAFFVFATNHAILGRQEIVHASLVEDRCPVRFFGELFEGLHQGISDRHARETFLPTVTPRDRVATHTRDEGEVQLEFVNEPIDTRSRFETQYFGHFWFLGTSLQSIRQEDIVGVLDAFVSLALSIGSINTAGGFRRIPATEGTLVDKEAFPAMFDHRVGSRKT